MEEETLKRGKVNDRNIMAEYQKERSEESSCNKCQKKRGKNKLKKRREILRANTKRKIKGKINEEKKTELEVQKELKE